MVDVLKGSVDDLSRALKDGSQGFDAVADAADDLFDAASSGSAEAVAQMRAQADTLDAQIGRYRSLADELAALRDQLPEDYRPALDAVVALSLIHI